MTGTGTSPVTLSPATLAFGTVEVGSPSAAQILTITNVGASAIALGTISLTGANATDFSETTTCTTSLAPAGACTVSVTFTPAALGARSGSVGITAALSISAITITGTNASYFSETNTCGMSLAAGANCGATINFTPAPKASAHGNAFDRRQRRRAPNRRSLRNRQMNQI